MKHHLQIYPEKKRKPARLRYSIVALLSLLLAQPATQALELPDIGDTSESYLSLTEENELGSAFMRNLRGALDIVSDPEIESYITSLGERLTTNSNSQQQFHFFVINDSTINAFAGPGGHIGINTGLIMTSETESELASVVAHEIAHVTQRHLARAFEASQESTVPTTAAIIAAIILASQDSAMASAALATALASSTQTRINFTRQNEKEADRLGMSLLASSNFNPQGMPAFFERLYRHNKVYDSQSIEFLRTHPLTLSRVSDTRNRADQYPQAKQLDQTHYHLIKTKIAVLGNPDSEKSIAHFQSLLSKATPQKNIFRYGYALSLAKAGQYQQAMEQINTLIKQEPERMNYQVAAANIAYSAGDLSLAAAICDKNLEIFPHHHALTSLHSVILIKQGKAKQANALLRDHLRRHPRNPQLYKLLAQSEHLNKNLSASHEALAEYYYFMGSTHSSLEQLDIALDHLQASDAGASARIKYRKNQLKTELKESEKKK